MCYKDTVAVFSGVIIKAKGNRILDEKHSQVFVAKVGALLQGGVPRIRHAK